MHGVAEARQTVEVIPESIRLGMYLRKQVQDQSLMLSYLGPSRASLKELNKMLWRKRSEGLGGIIKIWRRKLTEVPLLS